MAADRYWKAAARSRSTPGSAGSQPASASTRSRTRSQARWKFSRIALVDPPAADPGWTTPTASSRSGSDPMLAWSSRSGLALPPWAWIQVATDSLAARPTATTSRASPSTIALSRMRWGWATIGERRSWARGRRSSVYWPKIGYTKELRNR